MNAMNRTVFFRSGLDRGTLICETKGHRKNNYKLTKEWDGFMRKEHTKKQVLKKRDELEKKYFGNKGDNPNN